MKRGGMGGSASLFTCGVPPAAASTALRLRKVVVGVVEARAAATGEARAAAGGEARATDTGEARGAEAGDVMAGGGPPCDASGCDGGGAVMGAAEFSKAAPMSV
jgi:hypothetical protein